MKTGLTILFFIFHGFASAQKVTVNESEYLHRAQMALTEVIVHDIFSPPVASRIYLYANLAAYEVLALESGKLKSFSTIRQFPAVASLSSNRSKINLPLAALAAFFHASGTLVFSEQRLKDSAGNILNEFRRLLPDKKRFELSVEFGRRVGDSILRLAAGDHYRETRSLRRYSLSAAAGRWIPTPPAYMAAVEPHWGKVKPFLLDSASQFKPPAPFLFGDSLGEFHAQAVEVHKTVQELTTAQKDIALFWDCNPFFVNTSGHLVFATKKLSPGGHWMSIAGIASKKQGADIFTTAKAYTFTAIALYDAFISCWDEKYRSVYIRPETYINSKIDENWRPLLQTPPFPEYTSGHSVISNAAATVLTRLYGTMAIEDNSEVGYGLPVRSFNSFFAAAEEAAISRLYGGIHFRQAIEHGQVQGRRIGEFLTARLAP